MPRIHPDRVLQDREALLGDIAAGRPVDLSGAFLAGLALLGLGGISLGLFHGIAQGISSALKLPVMTLLSAVVCFPALYVFGVLQGSRAGARTLVPFFQAGIALKGAIVAGAAPLLLFLSCVGSPYGFVLGAGLLASGVAEIGFLGTVERGYRIHRARTKDPVRRGFIPLWSAIHALVAVQLAWSLRPLIGDPGAPFTILEGPGGNMLAYVARRLLGAE